MKIISLIRQQHPEGDVTWEFKEGIHNYQPFTSFFEIENIEDLSKNVIRSAMVYNTIKGVMLEFPMLKRIRIKKVL